MKEKTFIFACLLMLSPYVVQADNPPTAEEKAFAVNVADTLQERIFALLLNEFANTSAENFAAGEVAISLVFNDDNRNFRLVGTLEPLRSNDVPQDDFEVDALAEAMLGKSTEGVYKVNDRYYFRRSVPLNNFDPSCAICHQNYASPADNAYVGALMLQVPVVSGNARQ
ncbi:MAG: DUF3365 domain-containing protein [Saprospiraceae bacterium]|nr:DUF3365 domain-containing protein [Saprospiraceae bacterium]